MLRWCREWRSPFSAPLWRACRTHLLAAFGAVARAELLGRRVDGVDGLQGGAGAAEVRHGRAVYLPARNLQLVLDQLQPVGAVVVHVAVVYVHQPRGGVEVDADT